MYIPYTYTTHTLTLRSLKLAKIGISCQVRIEDMKMRVYFIALQCTGYQNVEKLSIK